MNTGRLILAAVLLLTICAGTSCGDEQRRSGRTYTREELIELNRRSIDKEKQYIDAFAKKFDTSFAVTPTGLRYQVYGHGSGDSARTGMIVEMAYRAYLLDSTLVGSATERQPLRFRVGYDDVVSGLHEAATLFREGDSVRLIIPSHLGYGLTGRGALVPPNSSLYYDFTLLSVY